MVGVVVVRTRSKHMCVCVCVCPCIKSQCASLEAMPVDKVK